MPIMKTLMMMPMMPTIDFPILHVEMSPPSSYQSSICDHTHSEEDYNKDEDNNSTFAYASASPCATRSNNHKAIGSTSNAINDSNNCNAVSGSDDDIM
jgi:hypothetical protein